MTERQMAGEGAGRIAKKGAEDSTGDGDRSSKNGMGRLRTGGRLGNGIVICQHLALNLYGAALLVILPLALKNKYSGVGDYKYELFKKASFLFLPLLFLLYIAGKVYERIAARRSGTVKGKTEERVKWRDGLRRYVKRYGIIDACVVLYLILAVISFLGARDKQFAFYGSDGWYMGLLSQLLFVGIYFAVSRMWSTGGMVWYMACAAALLVFACGVLHRFQIDLIGVYDGLTEDQKLRFLSTLGQATWYSSYVCTIFPLGLYVFYKSDKVWLRFLAGIFAAAGFATIVTQNSDSAFVALLAVLVVLFYLSFDSVMNMGRFLEVLLLMLFSFEGVGLLQNQFASRAMQLDTLSTFASQSIATGAALIVLCAVYCWYTLKGFRFLEQEGRFQLRRVLLLFLLFLAAGSVFLIAANTSGMLDGLAGGRKSGYLYFDDNWGSGRGKTWKFTVRAFAELPFWRKLIGVGPDCYADYFYSFPGYMQQLRSMWGDDTLTNSHNEWMNAVICYGIAGGAAYLGIFIGSIREFLKRRKVQPQAVACALCMAAYAAHNIFCYQQVLCTPFAFWILGMGSALLRREV